MKNILLGMVLVGNFAFAGITEDLALERNKNILEAYKISGTEKIMKEKLESSKRIGEQQKELKEKYKLNLEVKEVSEKEIMDSKIKQADMVKSGFKDYLEKQYKNLTVENCSKFKEAEIYLKAICKAKNEGKIEEAEKDLEKILKLDDKAYCMKAMISLGRAEANNEVISNATKDAILVKMKGFKKNAVCDKTLEIASQEVKSK